MAVREQQGPIDLDDPDLDEDGDLDVERYPVPSAAALGIKDPYFAKVWDAAVNSLDDDDAEPEPVDQMAFRFVGPRTGVERVVSTEAEIPESVRKAGSFSSTSPAGQADQVAAVERELGRTLGDKVRAGIRQAIAIANAPQEFAAAVVREAGASERVAGAALALTTIASFVTPGVPIVSALVAIGATMVKPSAPVIVARRAIESVRSKIRRMATADDAVAIARLVEGAADQGWALQLVAAAIDAGEPVQVAAKALQATPTPPQRLSWDRVDSVSYLVRERLREFARMPTDRQSAVREAVADLADRSEQEIETAAASCGVTPQVMLAAALGECLTPAVGAARVRMAIRPDQAEELERRLA